MVQREERVRREILAPSKERVRRALKVNSEFQVRRDILAPREERVQRVNQAPKE